MSSDAAALEGNTAYIAAMAAQKKGKHDVALRELISLRPQFPSCAKLSAAIDRAIDATFGVRGSDGTISLWNDAPLSTKTEPPRLQFSAYVQVGRKIYRHGGLDFVEGDASPSRYGEELWEFDIDQRKWTRLETAAQNSPGPRAGHTMFVWKKDLYLWGGMGRNEVFCSKLFRLKNVGTAKTPLKWEAVKAHSMKPPGREEHAGCLYKGKYYITGGTIGSTRQPSDDLWVLSLSNFKWTSLKNGLVTRHCHEMWASKDKLYVIGGRTKVQGSGGGLLDFSAHSIEDFVSYDIAQKTWKREEMIGDRPYDLSEFTLLPLYGDESTEEPSSIIVFGGYGEGDRYNGPKTVEESKAHYGDDWQEFTLPYRSRMLRFDVSTGVWRKLNPTTQILPKAQSFAAVSTIENGVIQILIGGGYGFQPGANSVTEGQQRGWDQMASRARELGVENQLHPHINRSPLGSNKVYQVSIAEGFGNAFESARWCWDLYSTPDEKRPNVMIDVSPFSPTLYIASDSTHEDFMPPPCDAVLPNDQKTLLGVRVKLSGLQGRADLNGRVGRCGCWLEREERYRVFLSSEHRGGKVASVSVKPSNLHIAKALDRGDSRDLMSKPMHQFPSVLMTIAAQNDGSGKQSRPLLDEFLDPRLGDPSLGEEGKQVMMLSDTYHGPVSRRAQAILRTVQSADPGSDKSSSLMTCTFIATKAVDSSQNPGQAQMMKSFELYSNFVRQMIEEDTVRVAAFEKSVAAIDDSEVDAACGKWLKLTVNLDGIHPPIQRELIVSPDITMTSLHSHVLCPAFGWRPNYHSYAFRRIALVSLHQKRNGGVDDQQVEAALKTMEEECWIGPKVSTSLDAMFQPLYVGGALANDKKISLGQLFALNRIDGEVYLQYVHDFGDWWSHTICVSKHEGPVPNDATVAHLISGEGGNIPDDVGGLISYTKKIGELTGHLSPDGPGKPVVTPNSERWWSLLDDLRGQSPRLGLLSNPLHFNIEAARSAIQAAVRSPTVKAGKENINSLSFDRETGLVHELNKKCAVSTPKSTKLCAVCGVTVSLRKCSRCSKISYCCREHQVSHWKEHKSDCKRLQTEKGVK